MASFSAGHVQAVRLLAEDVLAGVDGGLEVQRMEVRGGGDQHHVHAAVRSASGRRRSRRSSGRRRRPPARGLAFLSRSRAPCERSSKMSAMATSLHVLAGVHGVDGRPAAAAAAADQADLDDVAAGGMGAAGDGRTARPAPRPPQSRPATSHAVKLARSCQHLLRFGPANQLGSHFLTYSSRSARGPSRDAITLPASRGA